MNLNLSAIKLTVTTLLTTVGLKILGAIAIWIIGRWLISLALQIMGSAMRKQKIDPTLIRYISSAVSAILNIVLVIAMLGFFGVETTSFAALIAAAGIAIGMAWSGLLSNFAGGVFLVILQPFKVGDFITAAGITGTVEEIGLFATTLDTPDNVKTIVGNGKIFADTIQNFSANPYRRVELTAQLAHGVDPNAAVALLKPALARIPNVMTTPAPDVRNSDLQSFGRGTGRPSLLQQRTLLAGLFRHEPPDPRHICASRLPGSRTALRDTRRGRDKTGKNRVAALSQVPIRASL
jgi:small conductance mechanosensitive channel